MNEESDELNLNQNTLIDSDGKTISLETSIKNDDIDDDIIITGEDEIQIKDDENFGEHFHQSQFESNFENNLTLDTDNNTEKSNIQFSNLAEDRDNINGISQESYISDNKADIDPVRDLDEMDNKTEVNNLNEQINLYESIETESQIRENENDVEFNDIQHESNFIAEKEMLKNADHSQEEFEEIEIIQALTEETDQIESEVEETNNTEELVFKEETDIGDDDTKEHVHKEGNDNGETIIEDEHDADEHVLTEENDHDENIIIEEGQDTEDHVLKEENDHDENIIIEGQGTEDHVLKEENDHDENIIEGQDMEEDILKEGNDSGQRILEKDTSSNQLKGMNQVPGNDDNVSTIHTTIDFIEMQHDSTANENMDGIREPEQRDPPVLLSHEQEESGIAHVSATTANIDKGVGASLEDQTTTKDLESDQNRLSPEPTPFSRKTDHISNFFTAHIHLEDGTVKNQIVTVINYKNKKPFLGGYRHKLSGIEYHNASVQTRPRPRPPPNVELFSRDTQTFQIRHQKVSTHNTTSTQMTRAGVFVSTATDKLIAPGPYETADDFESRMLRNVVIIQKYYRRWLARQIVDRRRQERNKRLEWEQCEKEIKLREKEDRIKHEYDRRMHPKTRADFDLLYNGLEKWRLEQLAEINASEMNTAEKKAAKLLLLDEETDLLAAIDRHKIDRSQQTKSEEVQKLLGRAAAPKTWKDAKGRPIEMDTAYTIRSRELLDILNSLNMQYLTHDERLDVLLTLKHTVKEHDCKLTRDIIDLIDREADLIMRDVKDSSLVGLRKRIVTLFLQYCKTPTFNPEISLLLKVPPDPVVLVGDINYCKFCGRYLRITEFSLSIKSSKLTICKSCARKENQSRNRQDYSHYRRILKDLHVEEQQAGDDSKIAFILKQNDIKTLMESVWDSKSILSECEDFDDLVFVRWDSRKHWSPWNTILLTKDEAEAHKKVTDLIETYSKVMINRINQKHVIAKNMFESLEKMTEKMNLTSTKSTVKVQH